MISAVLHLVPVLGATKSKVPFYILAGALALWALLLGLVIAVRRPDFPTSATGQRGVMAITAVLVLGTAIAAVATSSGDHNTVSAVIGGTPAGGNVGTGGTAAPGSTASTPTTGGTISESAEPSGALAFTKPSLHATAGRVTINFANMAPEMHNMTIASGTTVLAATPTFTGGSKTLSLTLKPGTYVFYCSVPGHRQAGMQGTLTVS